MRERLFQVWLLSLATVMVPGAVVAYETDQFSNRLEPIADSMVVLDNQVNRSIEEAVNSWAGDRDDWKFVNLIYRDLGGRHWVDKIERWAMNSDEVERLQIGRHDSIYKGHPFWATRVAGLFGVGPTFKVDGQLIGSDKLGHFFSQGRKFYRRYMRSQDEAKAAEHSAYTERALFGQMTTGVYSNADLVANYEGFLFYQSLFEDNVTPGKKAILSWQDGKWVVQRPFTWADHVNEYWDEALNINHFDRWLYPHMQQRLYTFCTDYQSEPERYSINDESHLQERYHHLELRNTSELRLDRLCAEDPTPPAMGSTSVSD